MMLVLRSVKRSFEFRHDSFVDFWAEQHQHVAIAVVASEMISQMLQLLCWTERWKIMKTGLCCTTAVQAFSEF